MMTTIATAHIAAVRDMFVAGITLSHSSGSHGQFSIGRIG
jgi:hypothetical protein